jgi:hypothetical protein
MNAVARMYADQRMSVMRGSAPTFPSRNIRSAVEAVLNFCTPVNSVSQAF